MHNLRFENSNLNIALSVRVHACTCARMRVKSQLFFSLLRRLQCLCLQLDVGCQSVQLDVGGRTTTSEIRTYYFRSQSITKLQISKYFLFKYFQHTSFTSEI